MKTKNLKSLILVLVAISFIGCDKQKSAPPESKTNLSSNVVSFVTTLVEAEGRYEFSAYCIYDFIEKMKQLEKSGATFYSMQSGIAQLDLKHLTKAAEDAVSHYQNSQKEFDFLYLNGKLEMDKEFKENYVLLGSLFEENHFFVKRFVEGEFSINGLREFNKRHIQYKQVLALLDLECKKMMKESKE